MITIPYIQGASPPTHSTWSHIAKEQREHILRPVFGTVLALQLCETRGHRLVVFDGRSNY
jgi:hypothetical protein